MGYLAELNPDQQAIIDATLARVKALRPGQTLSITATTPQRMTTIRYVWYSYLNIVGLKELFRLRQETPVKLTFIRKDNEPPKVEGDHAEAEAFVQEHLIEADTEAEAINICERHNLSVEQQVAAICEWRRFQGIG
jgi:hypothetical protein